MGNEKDYNYFVKKLCDANECISAYERKIKTLQNVSNNIGQDAFYNILRNLKQAIYVKGLDGKYIYTNKTFDKLLNIPEGFSIEKKARDLFPQEIASSFSINDRKVLEAEMLLEFREMIPSAQGDVTFHSFKFPIYSSSGEIYAVAGISTNLTSRKNVDKSFSLNESRLEALQTLGQMTSAPLKELTDFALEEAIKLTRSKIGYLAFMDEEERVLTMHSWSEAAMAECRIRDKPMVYPIEKTGLWGEAVRQKRPIITNDYNMPNPLKKGHPEGHVAVLRHMNIPVVENDKVVAVAGVGNKVEEYDEGDVRQLSLLMDGMWSIIRRKRYAEEQQELRNYLSSTINSMPSQLIGVDIRGAVTQWNTQAVLETGITSEDAVGQRLDRVMPHLKDDISRILKAIRNNKTLHIPKRIREIDEVVYYEDIIVYPLLSEKISGAVIRLDNVTDRVRFEELMMQSEKMMSLGELSAGVAHEINNPISGILQGAQNILRRVSPDLKANRSTAEKNEVDLEKVYSYLEDRGVVRTLVGIQDSGRRAAKIVANMLNFSRKKESEHTIQSIPILLDETLNLTGSDYSLKKHYDFRRITIDRQYAVSLPKVRCDRTSIQQVFFNIFKNGAEAMALKKYGADEAPAFIVRIRSSNEMVIIEIEDNGPGLEESVRKKVLEPFFTTKGPGKGTGLGLSVAYHIVTEEHGGKIEVQSCKGEWTRFVIALPF